MTDTTSAREIVVSATWRNSVRVEVPDGVDLEEAIADINRGDFPDWVAIDSSTADMTDWDATDV